VEELKKKEIQQQQLSTFFLWFWFVRFWFVFRELQVVVVDGLEWMRERERMKPNSLETCCGWTRRNEE